MNTAEAIEITTFKLKGYSCKAFIEANNEVDEFLMHQPGFISRRILEQNGGKIADILLWDSVTQGTQAMHKLMDELSNSAVHDMIDQNTVHWSIAEVAHKLEY